PGVPAVHQPFVWVLVTMTTPHVGPWEKSIPVVFAPIVKMSFQRLFPRSLLTIGYIQVKIKDPCADSLNEKGKIKSFPVKSTSHTKIVSGLVRSQINQISCIIRRSATNIDHPVAIEVFIFLIAGSRPGILECPAFHLLFRLK